MRAFFPGVCLSMSLLVGACAPAPAPRIELPPPPTPALQEEEVRPLAQPHLEIVNLQENPSADKKRVTLTGTVRNQGTGPTHQVSVRVEARDANDAVVLGADATPRTEEIPPGGTATFSVTVDNRPDVVRYHVETLAR